MIEPAKDLIGRMCFEARWQIRARDHDDGQVKCARGLQFRDGTATPGILRNDQLNTMLSHQRGVSGDVKWTARDDDAVVRHRWRRYRLIDQPENVVVLRLRGELRQMHASDGQQDPLRRSVERIYGSRNIGDRLPAIRVRRLPGGTGQRDQRHARSFAGRDGVAAHLFGERMRRIDDMRNPIFSEEGDQAIDTAEATDAMLNGLRARAFDAPGVGQRRFDVALGDGLRKSTCLYGAAQDQEVVLHDD